MAIDITRATVKVMSQCGAVGTGFVLDLDGRYIIVTCAHVVGKADSQPKIVFTATGEERQLNQPLAFYSSEEEDDLAVLQPQGGLPEYVTPLKLGRSIGSSGHSFHTFGYPQIKAKDLTIDLTIQGLLCEGTIDCEVKDENRRPFLQLTSEKITQGVSGAPVLDDETGRIVGMVVWSTIKEWEYLEEKIKAAIIQRKPKVSGTVIPATAYAIPAKTIYRLLCNKFPTLDLHPPQALEDYLNQVRAYCSQDPYRVWDIRPKALEDIYVPLQLRYRPPMEKRPGEATPPQEKLPEQILLAAEALAKSDMPHLIIVAGPGAGKSTLLRQFAKYAWKDPDNIGLTAPHIPVPVPLGKLETEVTVESSITKVLNEELDLMHDLPSSYWKQWPDQTGANWLILLDALDEVPSGKRKKIMERVRALPQISPGSRIVITSRPSGYTYGELDPKLFRHYELEPFGPEQVKIFSRQWLDDAAESFLVQYDQLEAGDLKNTPLLLTLAARIYKEKQSLPPQRSALYGELVERTLDRAIENGINEDLGDKLAANPSLHEIRLSYLAQSMTGAEQTLDGESIKEFVTDYFQKKEGLLEVLAQTSAERWLGIMGRRSGLLIRKGERYAFLHPTVREYLTAKYLLKKYRKDGLRPMVQDYWHLPRYEEVLAFALSIRANKPIGVTDVIDALTWLVSYGAKTYQQNPEELFIIGRSPLRIALHLVRSASLALADLPELNDCLRSHISVSELRQHAVAVDHRTPEMILQWLSEVGSEGVQWRVAANFNTPPAVLQRLAEVGSERVQENLAFNPNTPPEVLQHLAEVGSEGVQENLARNPNTPPEVLSNLANVGIEDIQKKVASNPNTPPEVLRRLAEVGSESVQWLVARNPNSPPEALKHLTEVGDENIQKKVASNPNTPPEVLRRLAEVSSESVQWLVARNPNLPPEALRYPAEIDKQNLIGSKDLLLEVARHPSTSTEVLKHLAEAGSESVQCLVARNPNTPPEVLAGLAAVDSELVQRAVAYNLSTAPESLRQLAKVNREYVQILVAGNFNTPPEVLAGLAEVDSELDLIQIYLATNPQTPPEVLRRLAEVRTGWAVQATIGTNPNTPPEVLQHLAEVGSEEVQVELAKNPNVLLESL